MIDTKEGCPLRLQSEKLLIEELPNELMIFDQERNKAFCLNQTAAFVWKQADGKTPVAEIAKRLERDPGRPVDEQVIWFALEVLSKDGLLSSPTVPPSAAAAGVTRRDLLQKMGVGAVALPVVTVLFVSPPKRMPRVWSANRSSKRADVSCTTTRLRRFLEVVGRPLLRFVRRVMQVLSFRLVFHIMMWTCSCTGWTESSGAEIEWVIMGSPCIGYIPAASAIVNANAWIES